MGIEKSDDGPVDMSQSVKKLLEDNAKLEEEVTDLQLQLKVRQGASTCTPKLTSTQQQKVASEKLVRSHVLFTNLQQHASALEHTVQERDSRIALLVGEINLLRRQRVDLERSYSVCRTH